MQIAVMLLFAIIFGQIMRQLKQPAVLGEMIGGIILGPTIFGMIAPSLYNSLFNSSASVNFVRDASIKLGMLFSCLLRVLKSIFLIYDDWVNGRL
jgi:Kef-type K+ transport system membrane component KefB